MPSHLSTLRLLTVSYILSLGQACPGSASAVHAHCKVTVTFQEFCSTVMKEVLDRVAGTNGWRDPHNGGKYAVSSAKEDYLLLSRLTGDGKYTDKLDLTFTADGETCAVVACSESQVFSIIDFSTNYCNLHDLWCSSKDGCPIAGTDLVYSEDVGSCSASDKSKCVVPTSEELVTVEDSSSCPPVTTQTDFDLGSYITGRWYIQQQQATAYLPATQNYCVYAEYSKLPKKSLFGYTIQVHNYAQEANGTPHDSGSKICARQQAGDDPAKLEVAPCFLPSVAAGPYWVLAYDETAGYALVSGGQPEVQTSSGCRTGSGVNGAGLWIFTRTQQRDEAIVQKVRGIAQDQGFDLSVLNDVDQTGCEA